uniref:Uncharacterized protein n=1 Tax=Aegilops tauschii TaxID=37682 RepID=M8C4L8_AEGTA
MALGHTCLHVRRHQQQHASSSSCSAPAVAAFVGLCLVAVWMASSTLVTLAEFSPFQAPLLRRPAAPVEGTAGADKPPVGVREESADEQEPPMTERQQADHSTEKAKGLMNNRVSRSSWGSRMRIPARSHRQRRTRPRCSRTRRTPSSSTDGDGPGPWRTQAAESNKERTTAPGVPASHSWKLCDVEAGADYILPRQCGGYEKAPGRQALRAPGEALP